MAFINHATKNLAIKVVYYGPGLSGKTTNLRYLYFKLDPASRGELICLETETERTFFFDLLPIKAGLIGDFRIHIQLFTVPGQVFYEASRKSVLKGADGLVFIADSQIPLLDANLESFDGMRKNLLEYDMDLNLMPLVFQYNKRDLDSLIPVETFNNLLNPNGLPYVEASAINGVGVVETLREIVKLTIPPVSKKVFEKEEEEKREEVEKEEEPDKKKEIEFAFSRKVTPVTLKKIKIESKEDIDEEIERLTKEFTEEPEN
jgi:signal recognition particle receptor subunit beta